MTDSVIITSNPDIVITEADKLNIVTEQIQTFNVITEGIQGPPGASGIGGYDTDIKSPEAGDLITFSGTNKWVNIRRVDVSDGGNF